MNSSHEHSGFDEATADVEAPLKSVTSFDSLLPASRRTTDDEIESPALTIEFLQQELGVKKLNDIHDRLWLAGRPMPPRPLHYQKAQQRNITIHESMDLHLVWDYRRIFLKPIPRYLLDQQFWQEVLSCKEGCGSTSDGQNNLHSQNGIQKRVNNLPCERCTSHQCALGFMLSYASLISYEHDFHIAKDADLVPAELTWQEWRSHVRQLISLGKRRKVNKRYIFGELRLGRLNKIYRYTLRSPVRGYLYGYNSYAHFWHENLVRIASLFAYLALVLTAMQVGLATNRLQGSYAFQQASYGFTVFSIIAPLGFVGLVVPIFLVILLFNLDATLRYWKKRQASIDRSMASNAA